MKTKILFVCLGNICLSPSAEGVMQRLVDDEGLNDRIFIDSAGTNGWHVGERADARMRSHAKRRGLELTSISRKLIPSDLEAFDYVVGMDPDNVCNVRKLDRAGTYADKIHLMVDFCRKTKESEVPDPYYGGDAGFERVLDILEDACAGFLEHVRKERGI